MAVKVLDQVVFPRRAETFGDPPALLILLSSSVWPRLVSVREGS